MDVDSPLVNFLKVAAGLHAKDHTRYSDDPTMKLAENEPVPIGPPGLGNPDPRDHVPYKPPSDKPVRRSGYPS